MEDKNRHGFKITYVFWIFIILLVATTVILLIGSFRVEKTVDDMQEITNEYIDGQNSINEMRQVSDYLTTQCQEFVVNGDIEDAKAYYKEIQVDKRRDKSLQSMAKYGKNEVTYSSLKDALNSSNELAETETYAMRLACDGYGIDPADISDILLEAEISSSDAGLSASEKIKKARTMVFDENYQQMKEQIYSEVYGSVEDLMSKTREQEIASYERVHDRVIGQNVLLVLLMFIALIMLLITAKMILSPLRKSTSLIRDNKPLPVKGASEYVYLAKAYNKMLEATEKHHEILSYEATHDELTSLYNRKHFETMREELSQGDNALMILDIDYFKSVNDNYGHEVGDKILQKVSGILASAFRSEDYVFRIGGDEFAVFMVQVTPDMKHVVERKINQVNEILASRGRSSDSDLPKVSLSIGVAFSSDVTDKKRASEDLFRKADTALYKVKEAGRNGFAFYDGDERKE